MIEADYLVIGAGAMGMAFADVLLTETETTIALVDRYASPGGHWNRAYPYVRLHQPSAFYGVNSRPLGRDTKDTTGGNAGLFELASGAEVVAYFDQVMNQQFLPTGRVRYFPMCEYAEGGAIVSLMSGETHQIAAKKVVDATYSQVDVPSMRPPAYEVAEYCVRRCPYDDRGYRDGERSGPVNDGVAVEGLREEVLHRCAPGSGAGANGRRAPRCSGLVQARL